MLKSLLSDSVYMPHIHCFSEDALLLWTMFATDLLIGLAYVAISLTLWSLLRRIRLPFNLVVVCFGLFIAACGATHFLEVWTLWHPNYWIAATIKILTAIASVGICLYLLKLRHVLVEFAVDGKLSHRRKFDLEKAAKELEVRVLERTREIQNLDTRFQRVSQATDLGVWYCDLPFDELNWNDKTKEHFWMQPNAIVKIADFYEHIHPDDRERTRLAIATSIDKHQAYDIEYRTIDPAQIENIKWIRAIGWTDYDSSGNPTRFDGITLDLTDQRRKDHEKQLLQTDLYDVLERISDGFFIVDATWMLTYANPVTQNFFELAGKSVVGKKMKELFPSPDRAKFMKHYDEIARTGKPDRFQEVYEGRVLQVHAYQTRERGVAIFYRDVTEQVEASAKLKESERRYATLTSAIPQLVWTCLADGRCDYLSQQWADYTGMPVNQQLDLNWLDMVIHPEERKRTYEHWMGAVSGLHDYDIEYRIKRFDGEYRWFATRGTPMRDDQGKIVYWVGTCTDIHNQKILAQELNESRLAAERASEAKTQFLANMSHEIRTPIGAITGFTELLKSSSSSDSDKNNFMMIIERNSKHLLRLIDDILDLSKVEAGKILFENVNFNFVEFLRDFESIMSLRAGEKSVKFSLKVNGSIPESAISDELRIRQILANIVGNAIKFTERGQVTAFVEHKDEILRITVSDTGVGIAKQNIANLFQPFSQADTTFTRKFGGTGLGLILSKRLAQLMGGDLILESSELGKGSTFAIHFKLLPAPEAQSLTFTPFVSANNLLFSTSEPHAKLLEGMRVLLAEDSIDNQILVETYLRETGAEISFARDGLECFEIAMKTLPDVILMDIQMPIMNGHEATKKLRASGFSKPIIALTAHAMREERDKCFESGCTDYLTKPIHRNRLIEVLARYLPR